jgi:hypothetical protein
MDIIFSMLDWFGVRIQLSVILSTVWGMVHMDKDHFYACPTIWTNFENFELTSTVQMKISKKCPDEKGPIWSFRDRGSISIFRGPLTSGHKLVFKFEFAYRDIIPQPFPKI